MIAFAKNNKLYKRITKDVTSDYIKRSETIKKALPTLCPDKLYVGMLLIDLWRSQSFCSQAKEVVDEFTNALKTNCHAKVFFAVCEKEFALDKSQVSRYMNIVDEFCTISRNSDVDDRRPVLLYQWKKYSFSQLSEMLSLTDEQRTEVQPEWSVRQIRAYKKELKKNATSQHDSKENEEPEQYAGLSRGQLIDILLDRDEERMKLSEALEKRGLTITMLLEEDMINDANAGV